LVGRFGKSAACLADVDEPPLIVVQPEHDRAEVLAPSPRVGVAANDALLTLGDLDLQPLAAAPLFVTAVAPLGYDSLQTLLLGRVIPSGSLFRTVVRIAHNSAV